MGAFEKSWMHVVLTKLGQHVKGMISVAVIFFSECLWSSCLIVKQNVSMTTNAILHSGLTYRGSDRPATS